MTKAKTKSRRVWLVLTYRRDDIRSVHMTREQARTRDDPAVKTIASHGCVMHPRAHNQL